MIELMDGMFIEVDRYNYTVKKMVKTKDKNTGESIMAPKTMTYHGNLHQALMSVRELYLKEKFAKKQIKLNQILSVIEECDKKLLKEIEKLPKQLS